MNIEELLKGMSLQEKIFQLEQFNSVLLKPLKGWDATGPMKDLGLTEEDLKEDCSKGKDYGDDSAVSDVLSD